MEKFHSIESRFFDKAVDFLDYLRPTNPHWGDDYECSWIFRGQQNANWKLMPSAWREPGKTILKPLVEFLKPHAESEWENFFTHRPKLKNLNKNLVISGVAQTVAEYEAVFQFAELADELGYPVNEHDHLVNGISFFQEYYVHSWPDSPLSLPFCLAQHHGIPTRLLDWTRNPKVAAFFAAQPLGKKNTRKEMAVWAINLENI